MSLTNYSGLQSSIIDWANKNGDANFAAVVPDFIVLFEQQANTELALRTRFNMNSYQIATIASTPMYTLPADFIQTITIINTSSSGTNGGNTGVVQTTMSPQPLSSIFTSYPAVTPGQPQAFALNGGYLLFAPTPDGVYDLEHYYYQYVPPLSASNTTNWLLQAYPNLYLFGSLVAAESYLGNDPRIQVWGNMYSNEIAKIQGSTARDQYGASPLTVRVDATV